MFPVLALKTDKPPHAIATRNDQYKQSRGPLMAKFLPPARWTPPVPPTLATSTPSTALSLPSPLKASVSGAPPSSDAPPSSKADPMVVAERTTLDLDSTHKKAD